MVDIVSKNGNLLLNVDPKADGTIPEDQKETLLEIGGWLDINGEAIYDTKYWRTFGEGPTEEEGGYMSEHAKTKDFTAQDIRFTQKENKVFAIMLDWPKNGSILIKSITPADKVATVRMLGNNATLKWSQNDKGLLVEMPKEKPGDYAFTLELTF